MNQKILYVTTFNDVLYNKSGETLIKSMINNLSHGDVLVCYEDFNFDDRLTTLGADRSGITFLTQDLSDNEYLQNWLAKHHDIIPQCYGGGAADDSDIFRPGSPDFWNKEGQVWAKHRASRYFRKIAALHHAISTYHDAYDIIYLIDSDCIIKKTIPLELDTTLFLGDVSMVYFWGKFRKHIGRGPETGFTGYCKKHGGFDFAKIICDQYLTGEFLNYKYWDDGYVVGQIILQYEKKKASRIVGLVGNGGDDTDILEPFPYKFEDLVKSLSHKTTRVMELPSLMFKYVHHFKNKHKIST